MDPRQAYVRAAASLVNVPLESYEAGVVAQFQRLEELATVVMAFSLADPCPPACDFDSES